MDLSHTKDHILIKEASKASGYSIDYLTRLCRAKKIDAVLVGRSWLVNKQSLEVFIRTQSDRKRRLAQELSVQRELEYVARAQTSRLKAPHALVVKRGPRLSTVHPVLRQSFALALTILVLSTSVYAAESGVTARAQNKLATALIELDAENNQNIAEKIPSAFYELGDALERGTRTLVIATPHVYRSTMLALVATPRDQTAAVIQSEPTNTPGETIAVATYTGITTFFSNVNDRLATLFGLHPKTIVIVKEVERPAQPPAPPASIASTYTQVITKQTVISGASTAYIDQYVGSYVDTVFKQLSQRIDALPKRASSNGGGGGSVSTPVSLATISGSTITNSTFDGSVAASTLSVSGAATFTGTTTFSGPVVFGGITGSIQCLHVDSFGTVTGTTVDCGAGGGGSGITSLNGLLTTVQGFATSSDANIRLTITSTGSTHTFTPSWSGILSVIRGGTGLGSVTANGLLIGDSSGTGYAQVATSSLGLSTTNINEGTNLFYTPSRFASALAGTTTDALTEGTLNRYYTDARARNAFTATATGLSYSNSTGVLSLTSGYTIPLTASTTEWTSFYSTPSTRITAGTNLTWSGNTLNGPSDSYVRGLVSASAPLSYNSGTGALALAQATTGADGYLSSLNFNLFTNKVSSTSLSASYPLAYNSSTGVFSSALSTTSANSWSALQQFNGGATSTQFTTTGATYLATVSGNVGIGTTAPRSLLTVGTSTTSFTVDGSGYIKSGKVNGVVFVSVIAGEDPGTTINNAITALGSNGGEIDLNPTDTWSFAVPIVKPSKVTLDCRKATLTWTGSTASGVAAIVVADPVGNLSLGGIRNCNLSQTYNAANRNIGIYSGGDPTGVITSSSYYGPFQTFESVDVLGFYRGYAYGNNVWAIRWNNSSIHGNYDGIYSETGSSNTGENMMISNTVIYNNNNYGLSLNNINDWWRMEHGALDYNTAGGVGGSGANITLTDVHMEQTSGALINLTATGRITITGGTAALTAGSGTDTGWFNVVGPSGSFSATNLQFYTNHTVTYIENVTSGNTPTGCIVNPIFITGGSSSYTNGVGGTCTANGVNLFVNNGIALTASSFGNTAGLLYNTGLANGSTYVLQVGNTSNTSTANSGATFGEGLTSGGTKYGLLGFNGGNPAISWSTAGNVGVGSTSPYAKLTISGNSADTNQTLFAVSSSTASATSTLFSISNTGTVTIGSLTGPLQAINGVVSATTTLSGVYGGTGSTTLSGILAGNGAAGVKTLLIGSNLSFDGTTLSATGGAGSSGNWFTPDSYGGNLVNSTTTALWLKTATPYNLIASSTFVTYASSTQLTTTGNTYLATATTGVVGIGSTTPYARLSINGPNGSAGLDAIPALQVYGGTGVSSVHGTASNGGKIGLFTGNGGNSTDGTGGNGGAIELYAGNGGPSGIGGFNGFGGSVYISGGLPGTSGGAAGSAGNVILAMTQAGSVQGSVGVGTTTPAQLLSVQGNGLFSGDLTVANFIATGTAKLGSITGNLQAINGVVSATTTLSGVYGGTGSTTLSGILAGNGAAGVKTLLIGSNLSFDGTTLSATGGSGGGSDFIADSYGGILVNSTTSPLWLKGTNPFSLIASSTFATYASSTQLTTTGNTYLATAGGNVGIASTTPWALLSVNPNGITGPAFAIGSSSATNFVVTNGGKVGIGTTTPTAYLTVRGNSTAQAVNQGAVQIGVNNAGGQSNVGVELGAANVLGTSRGYLQGFTFTTGAATDLALNPYGGNTILNATTGLVGVGSTTPYARLSIHANNGDVNQTLFAIGSSTATATSTFFTVSNTGLVSVASTSPYARLSIQANLGDTYQSLFAIGSTSTASSTTLFNVANNGAVGISTTSSYGNLTVSGGKSYSGTPGYNIASIGTIINTSGWSGNGFLFSNSYTGTGSFSMVVNTDTAYFGDPGSNTTWAKLNSTGLGVGTGAAGVNYGYLTVSGGNSYSGTPGYNIASLGTINNTSGWVGNGFLFTNTNSGTGAFSMVFNGDNAYFGEPASATTWARLNATGMTLGSVTQANRLDVVGAAAIGTYAGTAAPANGLIVSGSVGIGTTSPYAKLSVGGQVVASYYTATTTTASTFPYASTTALTSTGSAYFGTLGGSVGIGTAAPSFTLDVVGKINTDQYSGFYQAGRLLAYASSTNRSTVFGLGAGNNATTSNNTLDVSAFGFNALNANTGGTNSAFGASALAANTTGSGNTAVGYQALTANIDGILNTAVGGLAFANNLSGTRNVALGYNALASARSADRSIGIGYFALSNNLSPTSTVAIGTQAAVGNNGNYSNQGGVFIGHQSGFSLGNGSDYNTFLGYNSGYNVTTGYGNTLLGAATDVGNLTTGSNNIGLGYNTFFPSATGNNQLNIGGILFGTLPATTTAFRLPTSGSIGVGSSSPYAKFSIQSNNGDTATTLFAIGSSTATATTTLFMVSNNGNVGIGTTTPTAQLSTTGGVRFATFGAGALSTDALGNLTVSSDERLKDINGSFTRGLADIQALSPILYHWNATSSLDTGTQYAGFSAQNVQTSIPEAVGKDSRGYLTLSDRPILAATVNAIKELAGTSNLLATTTSSLAARLTAVEQQTAPQLPQALTTSSLTSTHITTESMRATTYLAPTDAASFTFASSTLPLEVLTTDGSAVNILKLATFTYAKLGELTSRVDALTTRIDTLEANVARLTAASSTPGIVGDITAAILNIFNGFGITLSQGLAQFKTVSAEQFVARTLPDGSSSAGAGALSVGTTTAEVINPLIHPSSKIFVTFNGPVTGSWYLTGKEEGKFRVSFAQPQSTSTPFDYFILQTEDQVAAVGAAPILPPTIQTTIPQGGTTGTTTPIAGDTVAPVITLNGMATMTTDIGSVWNDQGATATDDIDGDVTAKLVVTGTVDTSVEGSYTITYSVTDSAGNGSMVTRVVLVQPAVVLSLLP